MMKLSLSTFLSLFLLLGLKETKHQSSLDIFPEFKALKQRVEELNALKQDVLELKSKVHPAFFAVLRTPASVNKGDYLKFDKLVTNVDGGYSFSSGLFTAPRSGMYFFSTTIPLNDHDNQLVKNGNQRLLKLRERTIYNQSRTGNVVVFLNQGDTVAVLVATSWVFGDAESGKDSDSFCGFMIN